MSDDTKIEPAAEEWRAVAGYDALYEVSSEGAIRRVAGPDSRGWMRQQRVLRPALDPYGYLCVALSKSGRMRTFRVHRLVVVAFLGPRPSGLEVNHIDGNKRNNGAINLEYITNEANQLHAVAHGLKATGARNGHAYLSIADVAVIRQLRSDGASRADVAQRFGIPHLDYVTRITSGKVWQADALAPYLPSDDHDVTPLHPETHPGLTPSLERKLRDQM
jgi:hypothetical protein